MRTGWVRDKTTTRNTLDEKTTNDSKHGQNHMEMSSAFLLLHTFSLMLFWGFIQIDSPEKPKIQVHDQLESFLLFPIIDERSWNGSQCRSAGGNSWNVRRNFLLSRHFHSSLIYCDFFATLENFSDFMLAMRTMKCFKLISNFQKDFLTHHMRFTVWFSFMKVSFAYTHLSIDRSIDMFVPWKKWIKKRF